MLSSRRCFDVNTVFSAHHTLIAILHFIDRDHSGLKQSTSAVHSLKQQKLTHDMDSLR